MFLEIDQAVEQFVIVVVDIMFVALIDVSECKLVIVFGLAEVREDEVELCGESKF